MKDNKDFHNDMESNTSSCGMSRKDAAMLSAYRERTEILENGIRDIVDAIRQLSVVKNETR